MSARNLAETVAKRMMRDHDAPTTVTEAEEAGVLARRRPETVEIEVVSYPRQVAEKALGKGAHPDAVRRLFELWPEAVVEVHHTRGRFDGVPSKVTDVTIAAYPHREGDDPREIPGVYAEARCRLDCDVWNRQHGIRLAFNRALKYVKAAEDLRVMGGATPTAEQG